MGLGWPEEEEEDFCYAHAGDCVQLGEGKGTGGGRAHWIIMSGLCDRPGGGLLFGPLQFRLSLPHF